MFTALRLCSGRPSRLGEALGLAARQPVWRWPGRLLTERPGGTERCFPPTRPGSLRSPGVPGGGWGVRGTAMKELPSPRPEVPFASSRAATEAMRRP